jgi:hypothetical protein
VNESFSNIFRFEKSTDLPSPRCRSLVFATDHAIFCTSGLVETHNENNNKKVKISTVIIIWNFNIDRSPCIIL